MFVIKIPLVKHLFIAAIVILLTSCSGTKAVEPELSALQLPKHAPQQLRADFDLLVNALKEAHTGLYWYSSEKQFDSIAAMQRLKIKDSLNSLEFYNITAAVVAFSKEDHCDIYIPQPASAWLKEHGRFLPLAVVSLNEKIYILNNPLPGVATKGHELLKVNGVTIASVYGHIFNTFAADGFIRSSKFRYLDHSKLAIEYAKTIGQPQAFTIVTRNPKTGLKEKHDLEACSFPAFLSINAQLKEQGLIKANLPPATIDINPTRAILTFNTFGNSEYEEAGTDFKSFVRAAFDSIRASGTKDLIIDIRENGGGSEGNEDYLFSFLAGKPYTKYKNVEASAFSYSFLQYTDCRDPEERKELEADLRNEHYLAEDGRILRKPGIEMPAPLQPNPYAGNVYILTSGWTYSGGAEFASLMREHTDAVFIGEEVGGGYYGNTSGYSIELTLPNTGIVVDLPLLRFVLDVSDKVPFGRGVLPHYPVQPTIDEYIKGYDAEMEFALRLINKKQ